MALKTYQKKRDFRKSPEPKGKSGKTGTKLSFVIHRHKATSLHYDLRLELDGVLKSWAVPKGPSMNPEDKRLAIMVEDHPYDYKDFEGEIPEGNYGAGLVEIWDEGTYSYVGRSSKKESEKSMSEGLKKGAIKIKLNGKKLKGEFALAKMKSKDNNNNNWLLIKHADDFAVYDDYDSEKLTPKNSPINKLLHKKEAEKKKDRKPSKANKTRRGISRSTSKKKNFVPAMLAKETDQPFNDKDWIFEIKWDGYRAIAELDKNNVELYSRYGNKFNDTFPLIVDALSEMKLNAVLDGEIVVLNEDGISDFQLLQNYEGEYRMVYYVFDLLELDGEKLTDLPLVERKKKLRKILKNNDTIEYSDHIIRDGINFFDAAGEKGLEGIIAKKATSKYQPGKRTANWLKIKHHRSQEAIIAGFTKPGGSRKHFGSLVLAEYKNGELVYIGNVGTGFKDRDLENIHDKLKPSVRKSSPFKNDIEVSGDITWVTPKIVCEIKFSEQTNDQKLRHPVFLRIRKEKKAKEVTSKSQAVVDKKNTENELHFGKAQITISNPDKIFFPDEGVTKLDVVNYYQEIADTILPHLKDRPQSLKRNPNGITDKGFYHKDAGGGTPDWVHSKKFHSESSDKDIDYILCNNKATLAYLNNLGCIELNPWHSKINSPDNPDYLIIDIDPSEKNSFDDVVVAAQEIKKVLEEIGARGYCKTSGATGMHVYIPVNKKYTYDQVRDFAHLVCSFVNERIPDITTLERRLKKRDPKKIYLDYLQNSRGQTVASAYSIRPVKGATVSMPLEWDEVKKGISPSDFTIRNAVERIKKKGDIFKDVLGKGINLEKCLKKLNEKTKEDPG